MGIAEDGALLLEMPQKDIGISIEENR